MGLFNSRRHVPEARHEAPNQIPITQFDLSRRYDVYCSVAGEERLYEDVQFVGIQTFDRISEFSSGLIGGYLEIQSVDGSRLLIPSFSIQMVCEHGMQPVFKVLRRHGSRWQY